MKTITAEQLQTLEDLAAQGLLGGLPLQMAEKDIHVTDMLKALSRLEVRHGYFQGLKRGESTRVDDGIGLVFAGGTCLSKAHRLIARMSEDADIKVVLTTPSTALKKDIGHRARLQALHQALTGMFSELGLAVPGDVEGRVNPFVRDSHRYYEVGSLYESRTPRLGTLRPMLKLEVIHRHPMLPVKPEQFGYMYETLGGLPASGTLTIPCIHVAETLAEKVLSLLRRCHWKWSGLQTDELDPTLVRHVYDVHRIMQAQPWHLETACTVFDALVRGDADEFKGRDDEFEREPRKALSATLAQAKISEELQINYRERLLPLIFEGEEVSYQTAFSSFETAAQALIDHLR
jgi:hypothetical protein